MVAKDTLSEVSETLAAVEMTQEGASFPEDTEQPNPGVMDTKLVLKMFQQIRQEIKLQSGVLNVLN